VLDIGFGEVIVIAILALLVFGPDRLPKVAADAARALRNVREMATAARRELTDAAGLEGDEELATTLRDLRDLDPRRLLKGDGEGATASARGGGESASGGPGASSTGSASPGAASGGSAAAVLPEAVPGQASSTDGDSGPTSGAPPASPGPGADPDWT
jgi:sec-independent protein translocase protein TatB